MKKLRDRMQLEVVDILERVGVTCVMVTHDQEEAMTMAGRIAITNRGNLSRLANQKRFYEDPTTRYSAEFIGSVNVFEGVLKERHEDGWCFIRRGCASTESRCRCFGGRCAGARGAAPGKNHALRGTSR
ncbi:hypothetical protein ACLK17_05120 [Escherichia coli]